MQAQDEEVMAQIHRGITAFRATGAALLVPYLCTVGRTRLVLGCVANFAQVVVQG
jgi:hypothetical protein